MKYILVIVLLGVQVMGWAQTDSIKSANGTKQQIDSGTKTKTLPKLLNDTARKINKPKPTAIKDTSRTAKFTDTLTNNTDTLAIDTVTAVVAIAVKRPIDSFYLALLDNPYFRKKVPPVHFTVHEHKRHSKDEMFYLFAGLILLLAFLKLVFERYYQNIFRLTFQPSFRQKQTREQLLQSHLPSLLLNLFFVLSTGAYIALLIEYYQVSSKDFWWLFLYSSIALLVLYVGKYVFLSFAGWVFNVKQATDTYVFTVYMVNKVLGILLIPFLLLIAFSHQFTDVAITVSLFVVLALFIFRYIAAYGPVRRDVKVSMFHFLLYICAFEITPLLLIYKTLIIYMNKSL